MAEEEAALTLSGVSEPATDPVIEAPGAADMDLETLIPDDTSNVDGDGDATSKRTREEEDAGAEEENSGDVSKKQKAEKSAEEQRLEEGQAAGGSEGGEQEKTGPVTVSLGPKNFGSSVEMYDYFYKFLHYWTPSVNVNKYEHMVLLDLLKKGHAEPNKKIGGGINAFQVLHHPEFKSRCFFLLRDDESVDDFSFWKCVDRIHPLPEEMKPKPNAGGGKGGGRGRGHGRGRGRWRN